MKRSILFLSCILLGGCSIRSERVPCPHTAIVAEFSKTIDLEKKVPIRTEMDSLQPTCERQGDQTLINMRLRATSLRPLSTFNIPVKIYPSFFVAIVDEQGKVLSRTNHDLEVILQEKQTTKVNFIQIQELVPAHKNVTVYVGFNLIEAQVEFFQKERAKKLHDNRP